MWQPTRLASVDGMNLDWWYLARLADSSTPYAVPVTLALFGAGSTLLVTRLRGGRLVVGLLLWLSVCAVLGALLTPAVRPLWWVGPGSGALRCTVAGAWPLQHTAIDLFNVLLFVPLTATGVWALPRWWLAPLLATGFGVACEVGQGLNPAIGRVCDGADMVGYLHGIGVGLLIGLVGLLVARLPRPSDSNHGPGGGAARPRSLASPRRSC